MKLYVHVPLYETQTTIPPETICKVLCNILETGLYRGENNPILARSIEDADQMPFAYAGKTVVVFRGKPELKIRLDVSFGNHVPAKQILGCVYIGRGKKVSEAIRQGLPAGSL